MEVGAGRGHQVLDDSHGREDAGDLERAADPAPHDPRAAVMRDVDVVQQDPPHIWRKGARDQVEEGALAGTVRADDGGQGAGFEGQRYVADRGDPAEPLGQCLDPQHYAVLRQVTKSRSPRRSPRAKTRMIRPSAKP
jgi:hypothetical protein